MSWICLMFFGLDVGSSSRSTVGAVNSISLDLFQAFLAEKVMHLGCGCCFRNLRYCCGVSELETEEKVKKGKQKKGDRFAGTIVVIEKHECFPPRYLVCSQGSE